MDQRSEKRQERDLHKTNKKRRQDSALVSCAGTDGVVLRSLVIAPT